MPTSLLPPFFLVKWRTPPTASAAMTAMAMMRRINLRRFFLSAGLFSGFFAGACAAASAGGDIYLRGAEEGHLSTVTAALREAGCTVTADSGGIRALCRERLRAVGPVQTAPYPGFPTDAQAVLMAALLRSRGATVFEENIFENRYRHVDELIRMGASIRVSGRVAVVTGVERLHSAPVRCTDLRGGAALCVAALAAEGETRVSQICHIDRGYEDLARDLRALGADAVRVEETENG